MYMTLKLFSNTTIAFFTLLMVNLFIGIVLSTVIYILHYFQYQPGVQDGYSVMKVISHIAH